MADGAELILRGLQPAIGLAMPVTAFNQGMQDQNTLANQLLNNQLLQQRYSQEQLMNPLLIQEAQNKLALQGQDVTTGQMKLDQAKQGQLIRDMQSIATEALQMPGNARRQHILGRLKTVDFAGLDENELINEIGQLDDTQLEQSLRSMMTAAGKGNGETADIETFKYLNSIIAPAVKNGVFDESIATPEQLAAAKQLGLVAKAGTMTQSEREAYDPELARDITRIQAGRAGATEDAKARAALMADLDIKPSIQRRVEEVVSQVKTETAKTEEKRSNERAFKVYDSALSGLFTSLGETTTGPIVGMIPALTANQQTADGAVALMAPVMKEIFRSAGEGSFTEGDQKLLMRMLPDRTTEPEARIKQLATVDAIVRSKLGKDVKVLSTVLGREVSMKDVFEEAVRSKMSVDEVKQELGIE